MALIQSIQGRQILDSRGNPTVEVEITDGTHIARAAVPSGASTGVHEALEMRDGGKEWHGKGVRKAVEHVNNEIAKVVQGLDPQDQTAVDKAMLSADGTKNKAKFGANAVLGVSLATARLAAMQKNVPLWKHIHDLYGGEVKLPRPMMNVLNGGKHADSGLAVQECMIFPNMVSFEKNLQAGSEIFHTLKGIIAKQGMMTTVGDEGGFAPKVKDTMAALDMICEAITASGYKLGDEVGIAMDPAASEFYIDGKYHIDGKVLTSEELTAHWGEMFDKYPIESLEDSHHEDDFAGFAAMNAAYGDRVQLVGDDLLVTNVDRLKLGVEQKLGNSILIKVNQIGSLTETLATMKMAHDAGWTTVVSHRSGETEDTFIADLAVGTGAGQIKTGSLSRSDRVAKYNQLLRISEEL